MRELPDDPLEAATVNIEKIQANIRQLKKLGADLGGRNDTQALRDRLQEGRRVTNVLCKETSGLLKPVDRDLRAKQDKLKRTLQTHVQDFEAVSQEHRRKEREIVVAMEERYSQKYGAPPDLSAYGGESYSGGSRLSSKQRAQTQIEMDSQQMDEVDLAIIQDRNRDLQALDNDMEQLAEVFQDVNRMVGVQGEQIDQAADNVEVSESNSAAASQSLKKGAEYMSAYRKKVVIVVVIISIVIVVLVGILIAWACTTGPLHAAGKC